jgi:hypothetical protein
MFEILKSIGIETFSSAYALVYPKMFFFVFGTQIPRGFPFKIILDNADMFCFFSL